MKSIFFLQCLCKLVSKHGAFLTQLLQSAKRQKQQQNNEYKQFRKMAIHLYSFKFALIQSQELQCQKIVKIVFSFKPGPWTWLLQNFLTEA